MVASIPAALTSVVHDSTETAEPEADDEGADDEDNIASEAAELHTLAGGDDSEPLLCCKL